jgi:hypothetical protein
VARGRLAGRDDRRLNARLRQYRHDDESEAGEVSDDWRNAWTAALDDLEMDVVATEAMLLDARRMAETPPSDLWQAPQELGALPLELVPRADEILTRQLVVAEEIARRLTSTRQQQAVTARIETGERVKRPLYLDCAM